MCDLFLKRTAILGVGITEQGRLSASAEMLAVMAARQALEDAGIEPTHLAQVFVSNVLGGALWGQGSIRGQVWMRELELAGAPIFNIESACAGGAAAVHLGCLAVEAGMGPVLVVGVEKMYCESRERTLRGIEECLPADEREALRAEIGDGRSIFMALNSCWARRQLDERGGDPWHFAVAASKAWKHASLNPVVQRQPTVSAEEVLASPIVDTPLTRLMCSSFTDGAAAIVLGRSPNSGAPAIRVSHLCSGNGGLEYHDRLARAANAVWEEGSLGPSDIDCLELHDATSAEEIFSLEALGFFGAGEAGPATIRDETTFGGSVVVNPSGGLVGRGHPIGATGVCQIVELALQLRGSGGPRQVEGALLGAAVNTGGIISGDAASVAVHVVERRSLNWAHSP